MNDFPIYQLPENTINDHFGHIPQIPKRLFVRGTFPVTQRHVLLTVVGSRNHTSYGKDACEHLIAGLAGYPIIIVSGLAHGIDAIAHRAALTHNIPTIAFPGSGLGEQVIYPRANYFLAQEILAAGGCLMSEYSPDQKTTPWIFPERNRLMAAMAHATLVIEATNKSGSRTTAKLATEYNRDVLVVPGNIFSIQSSGTHELLKLGAIPITCSTDIIYALGLTPKDTLCHPSQAPLPIFQTDVEQRIYESLVIARSTNEIILDEQARGTAPATIMSTLSLLELANHIQQRSGKWYRKTASHL